MKNQPKKLLVEEYCIKFRGNDITHEGKKWVWCKEQKLEVCFNGLYMPEGHNHEEQKAKKEVQNSISLLEKEGKEQDSNCT